MRDLAVRLLDEQSAEDILCLPAADIANYTDYLLLATGRSVRHQLTLAEKLRDALKRFSGVSPVLEGDRDASWLVLDCGSIVVHLQTQEKRDYYQLEALWFAGEQSQAQSQAQPDNAPTSPAAHPTTRLPSLRSA